MLAYRGSDAPGVDDGDSVAGSVNSIASEAVLGTLERCVGRMRCRGMRNRECANLVAAGDAGHGRPDRHGRCECAAGSRRGHLRLRKRRR